MSFNSSGKLMKLFISQGLEFIWVNDDNNENMDKSVLIIDKEEF